MTVFQPFFVNLDVPYATVIRGETFEIKGVVFNYQDQKQSVKVTLQQSNEFEVSTDGKEFSSRTLQALVDVPANDGASVSIWIKPLILGEITMQFSGFSNTDSSNGDALEKKVTVEPEGEIRYVNKPVFVRHETQATNQYTVDIQRLLGNVADEYIVQGSKMFQFQAIGDLLGPALTSLGNNIRMPTGCGEQTMVILAPNVYIYKYLKSVNELTDELESKSVRFVESGYQRELTYKRNDGGFSAFGNNDKASSTWLTAFVMRCFQAANKYVGTGIDRKVFTESWDYLKSVAQKDGTFSEAGKVLHHSMKGGATSADNLAAYLYIAFAEANGDSEFAWSSLSATKQRLQRIALDPNVKDPYQLALIAYGFSLLPADQSLSRQVLTKLFSMSSSDGDLMYWKPEGDQTDLNEYSRSGPSQIETSGYVLLTLMNHNMMENATMVARWLASQRNSLGGFSSTQDTVVGLQALAEFASKLSAVPVSLQVSAVFNFDDGQGSLNHDFAINAGNSKLLQSFDLPRDRQSLKTVDITVRGTGVSLIQLAARYNMQAPKVLDSGDYQIIIEPMPMRRKRSTEGYNSNVVTLNSCVGATNQKAGNGMVVLEIGVPTGFTADLETTKQLNNLVERNAWDPIPNPEPLLKRIELGDRKIVFYFDSLDQNTCVQSRMTRTSLAMNVQPPVARVFDYYEPSRINSKMYEFQGMSSDGATSIPVIFCEPGQNCNTGSQVTSDLTAAATGLVAMMTMLLFL